MDSLTASNGPASTGLTIPDEGDLRGRVLDESNWEANCEYAQIDCPVACGLTPVDSLEPGSFG